MVAAPKALEYDGWNGLLPGPTSESIGKLPGYLGM